MDVLERPVAAQRDMTMILAALAALKKGDGSVRLPAEWTGLPGKVAEAFNDVVELNQRMAEELARLSLVVGKEGKVKQRGSLGDVRGFWKSSIDSVNLAHRRSGSPHQRDRAGHRRGGPGRPVPDHGARGRRQAAAGRIPAHGQDHQPHGGSAGNLCLGSDACRPRGRNRRQARWTGQGERRCRHLEGPDRQRQLHGGEPYRSGAQYRRRHHRRCQGRLVEEDRRRREGRIPGAAQYHQHDGRPAAIVRLGGDARCARSGHRRQAWRSGSRRRRVRNLEGSDRQRQLDGQQPDRPGAQYRRCDHGGGARRLVAQDHGRRERRDPAAQGHGQYHGRPAQLLRRGGHARRARGGHGRTARGSGRREGRRGHVERSDRQRQLHGQQSHGPGSQHRRCDHGGGARRPVAQDHRRCEGRDPRAEEHDQHHGRSAALLCCGGDARCARGRYGRKVGWPGRRAGRRRHLEGPDRQRELDGEQPDRAGAQHRGRYDGGGARRSVAQDHGGRQRRDPRAQEHGQHDGRSIELVRGRSDTGCA